MKTSTVSTTAKANAAAGKRPVFASIVNSNVPGNNETGSVVVLKPRTKVEVKSDAVGSMIEPGVAQQLEGNKPGTVILLIKKPAKMVAIRPICNGGRYCSVERVECIRSTVEGPLALGTYTGHANVLNKRVDRMFSENSFGPYLTGEISAAAFALVRGDEMGFYREGQLVLIKRSDIESLKEEQLNFEAEQRSLRKRAQQQESAPVPARVLRMTQPRVTPAKPAKTVTQKRAEKKDPGCVKLTSFAQLAEFRAQLAV